MKHDLQVLIGGDNSRSNPIVKLLSRDGSAHNKNICTLIKQHEPVLLQLTRIQVNLHIFSKPGFLGCYSSMGRFSDALSIHLDFMVDM